MLVHYAAPFKAGGAAAPRLRPPREAVEGEGTTIWPYQGRTRSIIAKLEVFMFMYVLIVELVHGQNTPRSPQQQSLSIYSKWTWM